MCLRENINKYHILSSSYVLGKHINEQIILECDTMYFSI